MEGYVSMMDGTLRCLGPEGQALPAVDAALIEKYNTMPLDKTPPKKKKPKKEQEKK